MARLADFLILIGFNVPCTPLPHHPPIPFHRRKMAECDKTAQEMEKRFRQACEELEIPLPPPAASSTTTSTRSTSTEEAGDADADAAAAATAAAYEAIDFRGALLGRTRALPGLFEEVEALARADGVGEALAYYGDVRRFLRDDGQAEGEADDGSDAAAEAAFLVLRGVRAGERRVGRGEVVGEGEEGVLEIDWDAAMAGDAAAALGGGGGGGGVGAAAAAAAAAGAVEIDWGAPAAGDAGAVDWGGEGAGGGGEIEWAIEVEEAGAGSEETGAAPAATAGAAAGASGSLASGGEGGASLLADPGLRGELLNDLLELQSFLRQRRAELAADEREGGVAFVGQYQGAHAALQQQSLGAVGACMWGVGWGGECDGVKHSIHPFELPSRPPAGPFNHTNP